MRSIRFLLLIMVAVIAMSALSGCSSIVEAAVGAIGELTAGDGDTGGSDEGDAGEATADQAARSSRNNVLGSLGAFQNVMLFNVAYFQVFFLGGFGAEYDDFREGEGVTWEITGSDDEDADSFLAERALLKRTADGSWWYLAYRSEDQELEYEVLLGNEYEPVELVWADPDSGETMRYTFDSEGEEAMETDQASAGRSEVYDQDADVNYRRSTERVRVGAGTFTAEKIEYDATDEQSGEEYGYTWWVVSDVPGDLVKYEYRHSDDDAKLEGELIAIKNGYTTVLGAY